MISSSQRPLPDNTRHSQQTNIHAPGGIRTQDLSRRAAPPGAWIFVCCECRVLSGRGLCDELITRPEESYRLRCVVVYNLETSRIGAPYIYDISNLRVNSLTSTSLGNISPPPPIKLQYLASPQIVAGLTMRAAVFRAKTSDSGGNIYRCFSEIPASFHRQDWGSTSLQNARKFTKLHGVTPQKKTTFCNVLLKTCLQLSDIL